MPAGRPTKYKQEYCQKIIDYFNGEPYEIKIEKFYDKDGNVIREKEYKVANDLPLMYGFAAEIDVGHDTLLEWTKKIPEFSKAYKKARNLQKKYLITNGLQKLYDTAFAIFTMKNITNWRDNPIPEFEDEQKYPELENDSE